MKHRTINSAFLLALVFIITSSAAEEGTVTDVHVFFSCHLDVGYTALDNAVINQHFHSHYPKAITVAKELRRLGGPERLVFLTHSWLVSLFLDCPASLGINCPNSAEVEAFEGAVRRGDIVWHAMPHNDQVEMYSPSLLEAAVQLAHDLDERFGLPPKRTMSQRDVPGLTRAAVPILHSHGVRALSVGVNGITAPPGVPKNTPFWWRDEPSGKALLAFWHPGGYSGVPVDKRGECVHAPGFSHVLCMAWKQDNAGPPSVNETLAVFQLLRGQFPGAQVQASTFDQFLEPLLEEAAGGGLDLPVVTGEIGDTWIYGVAADPGKISEYRALLRLRDELLPTHRDDLHFKRFSRLLTKLPEHTWGSAVGEFLHDFENWSNTNFHAQLAKRSPNYLTMVSSWERQRRYNLFAVKELGDTPAGAKAQQVLWDLQALKTPPNPAAYLGFKKADLTQPLKFASGAWELELDGSTGAIVGLRLRQPRQKGDSTVALPQQAAAKGAWGLLQLARRLSMDSSAGAGHAMHADLEKGEQLEPGVEDAGDSQGASFASWTNPLAQVVYSTYSEDDYLEFCHEYAYYENWGWFSADFGKRNATASGAHRSDTLPRLQSVWHRQASDGALTIVTKATFPAAVVFLAGAPQAVWTEIHSPANSTDLHIDVVWENKTATRLPEVLWLRWRPDPRAVDPSTWVMHKLGQPISPLEVVLNGSHSLHAVGDEGVSVRSRGTGPTLSIRSLDAALVSPGRPTPFPKLSTPPDMAEGMAFHLVNNIWGTNYPLWIPYDSRETNMRFRFILQVDSEQEGAAGQAETKRTGAAWAA